MNCTKCVLHIGRTQIVLPTPPPKGGILAIGEAPGEKEDLVGEGFIGIAGKTLDKVMETFGISRSQYGRGNVCWCRPPGNRKPTRAEAQACLPHLQQFIQAHQIKVVLAVGGTPSSLFYTGGSLSEILLRAGSRDYQPDVPWAEAVKVVPMPHTSPLAWNRNDPHGRKWAEIGHEQVQKAIELSSRISEL